MKCNVGFLVSKIPNDGRYVPFFVKVRSKDIIWYDKPDEELLSVLNEDEMNMYDVVYPKTSISFERNGWNIKLNYDFTFEITRKFYINDNFKLSDDGRELTFENVPLPFLACYNDNLTTSATKCIKQNTNNVAIKYSYPAISFQNVENVLASNSTTYNNFTTTTLNNYEITDTLNIFLYYINKFDATNTTDENVFIDLCIKGEIFTLDYDNEVEMTYDLVESLDDKLKTFTDIFYEKFTAPADVVNNNDGEYILNRYVDISAYEDYMFVNLGGRFDNVESITFGEFTIPKNKHKNIYIGNNIVYVDSEVWKINDRKELLVSVPFLWYATIENTTKELPITINRTSTVLKTLENVVTYDDLDLKIKNILVSLSW